MEKWNSVTGEEILYNAMDSDGKIGGESMLEDAIKLGIQESSNNECKLLKFYYTDGFGWYFHNNKIVFILHECKVGNSVTGKTMKGYMTCLRKALLQDIGYFFKIKNREYTKFSAKLVDLAKQFGYTNVTNFIIDNFGMFLITTDKFVSSITMTDTVRELIDTLEPYIAITEKSPSKYWEDKVLRGIMEEFDVLDVPFAMMPDKVDLADTGEILNNILK